MPAGSWDRLCGRLHSRMKHATHAMASDHIRRQPNVIFSLQMAPQLPSPMITRLPLCALETNRTRR